MTPALRLLVFHLRRLIRDWGDEDPVRSLQAFKNLSWLRVALALQLDRAGGKAGAAAGADPEPVIAQDQEAQGIIQVYRFTVGRQPALGEISIWKENFARGLPFTQFLHDMTHSPEAQEYRRVSSVLPEASDGQFIQVAYESLLGRGSSAREVEVWEKQLSAGWMTRRPVRRS